MESICSVGEALYKAGLFARLPPDVIFGGVSVPYSALAADKLFLCEFQLVAVRILACKDQICTGKLIAKQIRLAYDYVRRYLRLISSRCIAKGKCSVIVEKEVCLFRSRISAVLVRALTLINNDIAIIFDCEC